MTLILLTSFTIFVLSILIYAWYNFKYLPQQYTKRLLSEGAVVVNFPKNPDDILYGIKKEIQTNPEMKAFVNKYPGSVSLFFTDTKLIKEVLSNHSYYSKLNKDSALNRIFNSKGVTVAEGEHWKLHRKILSEAFQYDLFNDMIPTIVELADEVIRVSSKSKKTIYAPRDIELITCEAVTRLFFGLKSSDVVINGLKASEEVNVILRKRQVYNDSSIRFALGMWALNLYSDYRDIKRRIQTFRDVFSKKIYERMEEIKSNSIENPNSNSNATSTKQRRDFLEILLQHRLKHNNDPSQTLSDEEILDEFSVFFLAGKDTTSLLVSMALYCFIKFPEWNERILAEMNDKIKDPYQINLDLLNSMDDLSAFLNEVLRMYPSAPGLLPRVANRDHYVGNIFVKKGYTVNALFIANHYNPKYFNNPEKFDPSRWIKAEAQARQEGWKNEAFAYLPFSAGARNCIGKHLALIEAKVILIMILKYHDVEIEEGFKFQLGNPGIGFGPQESIPFILTPKQL